MTTASIGYGQSVIRPVLSDSLVKLSRSSPISSASFRMVSKLGLLGNSCHSESEILYPTPSRHRPRVCRVFPLESATQTLPTDADQAQPCRPAAAGQPGDMYGNSASTLATGEALEKQITQVWPFCLCPI